VNDPGYAEMLVTAREVSAASGEFLMVARETFLAAGGMDEVMFPLFFASVGFCLKVRALGEHVVFTPHAKGQWSGPLARTTADPEMTARFDRELIQLRTAWPEEVGNDLFYSPVLALNGALHAALAWPPRERQPRRPRAPAGGPTQAEPIAPPTTSSAEGL
jgi:hypothetical protein